MRIIARKLATELYRGILNREPDPDGLKHLSRALRHGKSLEAAIREMIASEEYRGLRGEYTVNQSELEDESSLLARDIYRGVLNREPDPEGLIQLSAALRRGSSLETAIREMIGSDEFRELRGAQLLKLSDLPNITSIMPQQYSVQTGLDGHSHNVFAVKHDSDFDMFERLIVEHRFYDYFGGWGYTIDLDKRVAAAIVRGLDAKSCLEIGCNTGPVLSLLHDAGVEVTGVDLSHLAFALAYPSIRHRMLYGDILSLKLARRFDVVVAMDFFEHLSPFKIDQHIERVASLIDDDGYLYFNSPMYGHDRVFGTYLPLYLAQWKLEPEADFWHHIPCDAKGWPWDGHLVWAAAPYWEQKFLAKGLIRDCEIEAAIHQALVGFFGSYAPWRRGLFVLKHSQNKRRSADVAHNIMGILSEVEGLPKIGEPVPK